MKSITFTVQIQADCPDRSPAKKTTAIKLCQDINEILAERRQPRLNTLSR
jgi:hypothetical protein